MPHPGTKRRWSTPARSLLSLAGLSLAALLVGTILVSFTWLHLGQVSPALHVSANASHITSRTTTAIHLSLAPKVSLKHPLWWFAPFYDSSSFGQEASAYMLSLKRDAGVNSSQLWTGLMSNGCNYELGDAMPQADHADLEAMRRPSDPAPAEPAVVVCHNIAWFMTLDGDGHGCQPCPPRGYRPAITIVRAMAEANLVLPYTVQFLNKADEVWVPTHFSAKALRTSGLHKPLRILPQSFNTTFFDPAAHAPATLPTGTLATGHPRPPGKRGKQPFVFISVFKWETRKGWDVLLDAFFREFAGSQNVELYIVTHAFGDGGTDIPQEVQQHAQRVLPDTPHDQLPPVYVISQFVTNTDLARLYRASDVFVLPTRGEGWGRPACEAMSMGLPAIVTAWSGPAEYVTQATGYPLQYTLTNVEHNDFNHPRAKWAQPSLEHLRRLMRQASSDRKEVARKGQAARALMVERYSLGVVAQQLQGLLQQAEADLDAREHPQQST